MLYKRIVVKGVVQGVGFRAFIYKTAQKLPSIKGYVRNLPDNSVEIVCTGLQHEIEELINAAKRGPALSIVESVEVEEVNLPENFQTFSIKY